MQLVFAKMLTEDTPYLTREGEVWGAFLLVKFFIGVLLLQRCMRYYGLCRANDIFLL